MSPGDPPASRLGGAVAGLRRELDADLARVGDLDAIASRRLELDLLLDDLERQADRLREAAVVTLVGATGAGKSTLLNALVGSAVAPEGVDRPTTSAPVLYAPADANLAPLLTGLPGAAPEVVRYDARAGGPWTEQVLIDAPDVNSVAAANREVVAALCERSDVLLVLVHRQSLVEEASVSFVDDFAGRRELLFALNRADELTAEAREELLARLGHLARTRWGAPEAPVVAISAKGAQSRPDSGGFDALCAALRELVLAGRLSTVRRHNALGTAASIGALAEAAREDAGADLGALHGLAEKGALALAERVGEEVRERLRLRGAEVTEELWTEAARRWDGPVGWVLRARGASGIGLTAGAALLRRSPLLAAGAAAGGLAADAGRDALRARRLASAAPLLPEEGEFAAWYGETLGEARLAAARLSGEPDSLGVPALEAARERAGSAAQESWGRLFARDLPAAAERAAPAPLRLLLDVPVYSLAAWVVWLAGRGFFRGEYLGTDLLVNAGLLAAAYLLLARILLRRGLALSARRLLRRAGERAESGIATWADEVGPGARAETEARASALARLAAIEGRWRAALEALAGDGGVPRDPRGGCA